MMYIGVMVGILVYLLARGILQGIQYGWTVGGPHRIRHGTLIKHNIRFTARKRQLDDTNDESSI